MQEIAIVPDRLKSVLSSAPVIFYTLDAHPPHAARSVGGGIERQLGYTPEEWLANPRFWIEHVHPDDSAQALAWRRLVGSGIEQALEYRFLHKNGSYRWMHDEPRLIRDGDGVAVEIDGVVSDVTDRRYAEEALLESQHRYRALLEDDLAGIFMSSVDGHLLMCNAAFARILGLASVPAALATDLNTLHEEAGARAALMQSVRQHRRLNAHHLRLRRPDGTQVSVVANLVGRFGEDGELQGLKGYVLDDTGRAAAEEALRLSDARYTELFENANDIVFMTDTDLRFTAVNTAGAVLSGYQREAWCRMHVQDLIPGAPALMFGELLSDLPGHQRSLVIEAELVGREGQHIPIEIAARSIWHGGRVTGIQAIGRNISDRKLLEAQVRHAQKMEALGRLAGGVAHDFNNLLTVIVGYAETLAAEAEGTPQAAELVEIWNAGRRAAGLTRQLMAFSRKQVVSPKPVNLNSMVDGMHQMIRRLVGEDIELRTALSPGIATIKADPGQIDQVLMNLVVNARDAMPRGGRLTIETSHVELDRECAGRFPGMKAGTFAVLRVADNGVGMDAATRMRIFEPFFTTKVEGKGTGLGLSTTYSIVKQAGGHIEVHSEIGRGTTFDVYFPECLETVVESLPSAASTHAPAASACILLAEDDAAVREYVTAVLQSSGYAVTPAQSPAEAERFAAVSKQPFDLLLTDVVMSGGDGQTLARAVRRRDPGTKVLYMSGYTLDTPLEEQDTDRQAEFIAKPFTAMDLREKVRQVLAR